MAFDKMTDEELHEKFVQRFWYTMRYLKPQFKRIGARAIKFEFQDGTPLYFIWYDDNNWTMGTKIYRQKPKKKLKNVKTDEEKGTELKSHVETNSCDFMVHVDLGAEDLITGGNQN